LKELFEHDQEGRLLKHTDTNGLTTQYQYNTVGLLEQRIDANQHRVGYQWDKSRAVSKSLLTKIGLNTNLTITSLVS